MLSLGQDTSFGEASDPEVILWGEVLTAKPPDHEETDEPVSKTAKRAPPNRGRRDPILTRNARQFPRAGPYDAAILIGPTIRKDLSQNSESNGALCSFLL
jgi:hypothetical protein